MKNKQQLELQRLQAENDLLQMEIAEKSREPSKSDKISAFFKKWSSVLIAVISVGGGFWGIFYPIKSYYNEKSKELQFSLNTSMIGIVENLSNRDPVKRNSSIVLLSYYEENAIPILLYHLEKSAKIEDDLIITISRIYNRKPKPTKTEIINTSKNFFRKESKKAGLPVNIIGLINYRRLLQKVDFKKKHLAEVNLIQSKQDSILFNNILYELIGATGDNIELFITEINHLYKNPDLQLPIICSSLEEIFEIESQKQANMIQKGIVNYSELFKTIRFRESDTVTVIQTIGRLDSMLLDGKEPGSADHDLVSYYCEKMSEAKDLIVKRISL